MQRPGGDGRRSAPAPPADPDSAAAAEEVALRILNAASQSAAGLRRRLEQRGFGAEAAAAATAAMVERRYVDDDELARSLASRRQRSGHGRIRVGAELRARGIADGAIEGTLAELDTGAERAAALRTGRQLALRPNHDVSDRHGRQRLGGALQRRGFDTDTVGWVLRELERES